VNSGQPFDLETERQKAAATRNYVTPAVITLVLYFILWVPGLVANIVYYLQASNDQTLVGRAPEGKGCLIVLFAVFVVLPIVIFVGIFLILFAGSVFTAVSSSH